MSDAEVLEGIREVLEQAERDHDIRGEGHRKVHARLRTRGIVAGKTRVLRLMRENDLLAPTRMGHPRGPKVHDGTIITELPNQMWGTDGTRIKTRKDRWAWVFVAVDHCVGDCVGIHACLVGDRWAALQPILQGTHEFYGGVERNAAEGLLLRHDHGSQYTSRDFQREIRWLGIGSSPCFVRSPQGNGIAERFIRTLKEQLLYVETFDTVEELSEAVQAFRLRFNERWLLGRHGYATPNEVRRRMTEGHTGTEPRAA